MRLTSSAPAWRSSSAQDAGSAPFRVSLDAAEIDDHAWLVADGLGVVPGRDRADVAGGELALGAVVHLDVQVT